MHQDVSSSVQATPLCTDTHAAATDGNTRNELARGREAQALGWQSNPFSYNLACCFAVLQSAHVSLDEPCSTLQATSSQHHKLMLGAEQLLPKSAAPLTWYGHRGLTDI
jgi:hypothetical protein